MAEKILYVHCGYPKTATTTLQKWVFPGINGITYAGRTYTQEGRSNLESDIMSGIRRQEGRRGNEAFLAGCKALSSMARESSRVLISLEGIMAQCLVPKPVFRFSDAIVPAPTYREALEHVKEFGRCSGFEVIKPIITLRKQEDLLSSFFAEGFMDRYSRVPDVNTFGKFTSVLISEGGCVDESVVDYCNLENELIDIFGKDNYLFVLFDWIKTNPSMLASALAGFMNVSDADMAQLIQKSSPENVRRLADGSPRLKIRRMNARYYLDKLKKSFFPGVSLGLGRKIGPWLAKYEYGPETLVPDVEDINRIREHYRASNTEFVKRHPDFSALLDGH